MIIPFCVQVLQNSRAIKVNAFANVDLCSAGLRFDLEALSRTTYKTKLSPGSKM